MTSCSLIQIYGRFGEAYCLHLQAYLRQSVAAVQLCDSNDNVFVHWIIWYSPCNAKIDLRDNLLVVCVIGHAVIIPVRACLPLKGENGTPHFDIELKSGWNFVVFVYTNLSTHEQRRKIG